MKEYDIFISFSSKDIKREDVRIIKDRLEKYKFNVFFDEKGGVYKDTKELLNIVSNSSYFVALIGKNYFNECEFCKKEYEKAKQTNLNILRFSFDGTNSPDNQPVIKADLKKGKNKEIKRFVNIIKDEIIKDNKIYSKNSNIPIKGLYFWTISFLMFGVLFLAFIFISTSHEKVLYKIKIENNKSIVISEKQSNSDIYLENIKNNIKNSDTSMKKDYFILKRFMAPLQNFEIRMPTNKDLEIFPLKVVVLAFLASIFFGKIFKKYKIYNKIIKEYNFDRFGYWGVLLILFFSLFGEFYMNANYRTSLSLLIIFALLVFIFLWPIYILYITTLFNNFMIIKFNKNIYIFLGNNKVFKYNIEKVNCDTTEFEKCISSKKSGWIFNKNIGIVECNGITYISNAFKVKEYICNRLIL